MEPVSIFEVIDWLASCEWGCLPRWLWILLGLLVAANVYGLFFDDEPYDESVL